MLGGVLVWSDLDPSVGMSVTETSGGCEETTDDFRLRGRRGT